ncbi:MAG: YCF48-related protein [Rubrivivax sp.]|nr:YCF48-related protein [Rubrivivax sp.]
MPRARTGKPLLLLGMLLAGLALAAATGARQVLPDLLDLAITPAANAVPGKAPQRPVMGIARQGVRVLTVGTRGLILLSDDGAATWRQVASPVGTDLVSVRFSSPTTVWAVGHDAVILRSDDAGATWQRVLDGRGVLKLLRSAYLAATQPELAREVESAIAQSATPDVWPAPLLDIRFEKDGQRGWAVGAFGLLLHTADGGTTWTPWLEQADNERRYHLYALGGDATSTYIAGEQGLLLRLDAAGRRFEAVKTPYAGSYFGVDVFGPHLLAYGLRGNAYLSDDAGASWHKLETGSDANLITAQLTPRGLLLVSQAGDVLLVDPQARTTKGLQTPSGAEVLGAVAADERRLAVARLNGPGWLEWVPAER